MAAVLTAVFAIGCGNQFTPSASAPSESSSRLDDPARSENDELAKVIVLDWTGGFSDITSDWLAPLDFSELYLASGESLESHVESLQESVLVRVEEILSTLEPVRFDVVTGEGDDSSEETVVYFTSDAVSGTKLYVGQTKLDRCDLNEGASVVVWGGTLLSLGNDYGYEQWVNLFANIAAHEIGHTIGFFHPDAVLTDLTDYEKNTEIMLGVHTMSSLLGRQEFLIPQETCPASIADEFGGIAYNLTTASTAKRPTVSYKNRDLSEIVICNCGYGH